MSTFVLKIIACISMLFDHTGYIVFNRFSFFNYIGRLAFPIFCFQLVQGYTHTQNKQKYFIRLLIFALISQIPFSLFYTAISQGFMLNILFTFLLGFLTLYLLENTNRIIGLFFAVIFSIIAQIFPFDYGYYGILLITIFYLFRKQKLIMFFCAILLTCLKYSLKILISGIVDQYLFLALFTCSSMFLLLLYNNKQGPKFRYFFYIFYPCHLLVLYFISFL